MAASRLRSKFKDQPLAIRRLYGYGRRVLWPCPTWRDPEFKRCYKSLLQTQWWSREQLLELQLKRLHNLLSYAYTNVPYYQLLFGEHRITPKDIATIDDLQKLPILTRKDIQQNHDHFMPRTEYAKKLLQVTTGGTTGIPLNLLYDATVDAHEEAFRLRQWTWAGYRFGDRLLLMHDDFIGRGNHRGKDVKWDYETTRNALVLSTFHLNERNMPDFIALIRDFNPQYIDSFPSALGLVASYMRRHSMTGIRPKAIFCESETLFDWQRELIESQFGCKIFAGYGDSERAVDAVECEYHQGYHICMEYGILEIVDAEGRPVTEEGQAGRAVGTGLDTYSMPMIRYDTGDIVKYTQKICRCGRDSPLIAKVEGRLQEFVVTADDELIAVGILQIRSSGYNKVEQFQFFQEKKGELALKIVPGPVYSANDALLILDELSSQFHGKMKVELEVVDHIPRTSRGKYRFLEQRLGVRFCGSEEVDQLMSARPGSFSTMIG